jgi:hypothetical protein
MPGMRQMVVRAAGRRNPRGAVTASRRAQVREGRVGHLRELRVARGVERRRRERHLVDVDPAEEPIRVRACVDPVTSEEGRLRELLGPDLDRARDAFVCRSGVRSFPFDLCRERVESAGLVAAALAGAVDDAP